MRHRGVEVFSCSARGGDGRWQLVAVLGRQLTCVSAVCRACCGRVAIVAVVVVHGAHGAHGAIVGRTGIAALAGFTAGFNARTKF